MAAHILARALTPGDELNVPGAEYLLCSASIEQSRMCYRPIRQWLDEQYPGDYRFIDSVQRIGICHKASGTRLRVMSSSAKTSAGIVGCPLVVADEPGAWEVTNGMMMHDMIETAKGKPDSPLRSVYIGTEWPARAGWWPELIKRGTNGSTYVQALIGDSRKWDQWPEIRRVNPLVSKFAASRKKILEERDIARTDTRLMARFASTRLNHCMADESVMLLSVDDWELAIARTVPPRAGRPVTGVDCGGGRSWTAAVSIWPNGRTEAWALAPGIPTLEAQETARSRSEGHVSAVGGQRTPHHCNRPPSATTRSAGGPHTGVEPDGRNVRPFPAWRATGRTRAACVDTTSHNVAKRMRCRCPGIARRRKRWSAVGSAG